MEADEGNDTDESTSEDKEEDAAPAPASPVPSPAENTESNVITSLQNVCEDPSVNKDAIFLDALQNVF